MKDARAAITELMFTYAERIDAGDFDGLGDMFAHAVITAEGSPMVSRGRDEVIATYTGTTRRYEDDGTPKTKHVTTNLIIDADEEAGTGTCRAYFTVLQSVPGRLPLQPIVAGRYRDTFERVEGTWRFATRHMIVDLVGDVSQHLLIELPA